AVGGVWTYTLDLARGLSDRGIEVVLAILGPKPSADQQAQAHAVGKLRMVVTELPLDWTARGEGDVRGAAAALAPLAGETRANLVHLHAPALSCARYQVPVVAVVHSCVATWWRTVRSGPLPEDFRWRFHLAREGVSVADAVIAPSRSFAALLSATYGEVARYLVVHNGRATEPSGRGEREPAVLTAGRLWDEGKNAALLDRAAGLMDLPVYAAGPTQAPEGATCWFPNLRPLGTLPEYALRRRMAKTRVFASAARYEPFGLTVLEAAQEGAALVLSDTPTFRELWDDAAVFLDPDDAEAWAVSLARLAAAPDTAAELGERARARSALYSVKAMVEQTLAVHRSLLRAPVAAE
ncbi:MAG: glycosyltransferase family 4 protein, partial [Acetobacteraceae bacterium]|nr:glycosyltransferase family 4 protein [Acetobacteraceae bacterium]